MRTINKIAVLAGIVVCVCSCRKEDIPSPAGSSSGFVNTAGNRLSNSQNTTDTDPSSFKNHGGRSYDTLDIVGGGDGDRDGGSGRKMNPSTGKDSVGNGSQGTGEIVGGGDGDRDGGDDGSKKSNKG